MQFISYLSITGLQNFDEDPQEGTDFHRADVNRSSGYMIALPVNMPGQGSNETVERIFFIQEPYSRAPEDNTPEDYPQTQMVIDEEIRDHLSLGIGQNGEIVDNIGGMTHIDSADGIAIRQTGDYKDHLENLQESGTVVFGYGLENIQLTGTETEIHGRILGRSELQKLKGRRNSAPPNIITRESIPRETALCEKVNSRIINMNSLDKDPGKDYPDGQQTLIEPQQSGAMSPETPRDIREKDIRVHGPSASDPRMVTLAFQRAMLAQTHKEPENETDADKHDKEELKMSEDTAKISEVEPSSPTLVPVINVIPAEKMDDEDDVPSLFAPYRLGNVDHRFLSPIPEEVSFVPDRGSSPRTAKFVSILNSKHEKIYRVPRTTLQIMSSNKLKVELKQCAFALSSTGAIVQSEDEDFSLGDSENPASEEMTDSKNPAIEQTNQIISASNDEGGSNICKTSTEVVESEQQISPRTLEKIGNIVEVVGDGKQSTADSLLLDTPKWTAVEHAMQGNVNHGFVSDGDEHEPSSESNVGGGISSSCNSGTENVRNSHASKQTLQSESEVVVESHLVESSNNQNEYPRMRKPNPLLRQSHISDAGDDVRPALPNQDNPSTDCNQSGKIDGASAKDKPSINLEKPSQNLELQTLNSQNQMRVDTNTRLSNSELKMVNELSQEEKLHDCNIQHGPIKTIGSANHSVLPKTVEETPKQYRGRRSSKGSLSSAKSFPLSRMRAFSIDGSLYIVCNKKTNETNDMNFKMADETLTRILEKGKLNEMSSLENHRGSRKDSMGNGRLVLSKQASLPVVQTAFMDINQKREVPDVKIAMV